MTNRQKWVCFSWSQFRPQSTDQWWKWFAVGETSLALNFDGKKWESPYENLISLQAFLMTRESYNDSLLWSDRMVLSRFLFRRGDFFCLTQMLLLNLKLRLSVMWISELPNVVRWPTVAPLWPFCFPFINNTEQLQFSQMIWYKRQVHSHSVPMTIDSTLIW
jgi:hypothetical protein